MSVEETINYINDKLNIPQLAYIHSTVPNNDNYKYHISLNQKGLVKISEDFNNEKNISISKSEYSFFPKDIILKYRTTTTAIVINCNNDANCIFWKYMSAVSQYANLELIYCTDDFTANSVYNALSHLCAKINSDKNYVQEEKTVDPFAPMRESSNTHYDSSIATSNSNIVKMEMVNGIYEVPVVINGVLKIGFIFDSGASDVSISSDIALTLIKTGTLKQTDFIGTQKYQFGDGSTATSKTFIIRELTIGNKTMKNVKASISNSIESPMLLGQSLLQKFGKFTIDNINHSLIIE